MVVRATDSARQAHGVRVYEGEQYRPASLSRSDISAAGTDDTVTILRDPSPRRPAGASVKYFPSYHQAAPPPGA